LAGLPADRLADVERSLFDPAREAAEAKVAL